MNVDIDNLEHVLSTLTGFESLSNGDLESPDSVYTKTVLKLNGVDFKHRAGTEGFVSSVKDGAAKIYVMIKNFIKAIRDFFKGTFGKKVDQAVSVSVPEAEKSIKIIETKIRQDVISERAKQDVQASVERIKNKIEQMKKNVVDTPTAEKKIDLIIEKKKKAPAIYKEQETWDGGSVKITINDFLICDKAKFKEAVGMIDIIGNAYGMSAMNASHEFLEIRDLYEELKVPGDADEFKFVVDNLKTAKNVLYTLTRINTAAGDSIGVLTNLLEKINEENRVDKKKTNLTPLAIQQDRSLIVALVHSMTQLKGRYSNIALSISDNIKKIRVLVGGEEPSEQSKKIRQDAMDALAHVPE